MAWPYITQWYFEDGTDDGIGALTDANSISDVPHFSELARTGHDPYVGAYCFRVKHNSSAHVAYLADADISVANTETGYVSFALYLSEDFALASSATTTILELLDSTTTVAQIRLKDVSGTLTFAVYNNTDGTDEVEGTGYVVPLGKWMWVEMSILHNAAGATSVATLFVTREGESSSEQVATTAAATSAVAGPIDNARVGLTINASTGNVGTMLFDAYHWDDANGTGTVGRTPMPDNRWTTDIAIHAPMHAFVGPGWIENLTLVSGAATATQSVIVYDTDSAQNDDDRIVAHLHNTAANETVDVSAPRIYCQNGAYVELSDDDSTVLMTSDLESPRVLMQVSPTYYGSRSQIVSYGLRR